jgi:hypothetical protein
MCIAQSQVSCSTTMEDIIDVLREMHADLASLRKVFNKGFNDMQTRIGRLERCQGLLTNEELTPDEEDRIFQ